MTSNERDMQIQYFNKGCVAERKVTLKFHADSVFEFEKAKEVSRNNLVLQMLSNLMIEAHSKRYVQIRNFQIFFA